MVLQLNLRGEGERFKEFYGRNTIQMPLLVGSRRRPLSVKDLMQRRLEVLDSSEEAVREAWLDNYFDTGDAVVYHPDGRVKVVHDAQPLREMNEKTRLRRRILPLSEEAYEALPKNHEWTRAELSQYGVGEWLAEKQVGDHPIWIALARGDQDLLKAYAKAIFKEERQFNHNGIMSIDLADTPEEPEAWSWFVARLDYNSDAYGRTNLLNGDGRLVGVAPEVQAREISSGTERAELPIHTVELLREGAYAKVNGKLYIQVPSDLELTE